MKGWGHYDEWLNNAWVQAALVVFFSLALLALASFLFGDFCGANEEHCYGDYRSNNIAYVAVARLFEGIEAHNALITAIATALLTLITGYLWRLEKDSSATTRAQLRAYISGDVTNITAFDLSLGKFEAEIRWINSGATPARDFTTSGGIFFLPLPLPDEVDVQTNPAKAKEKHSTIAVFPNTPHSSMADNSAFPMQSNFVSEAREKRAAVFIYGEANYWDVFGEEHKTQICKFIDVNSMASVIDALEKKGKIPQAINTVWAHRLNHFT